MPHRYRISVQSLDDSTPDDAAQTLSFEITNHDDLFALLGRISALAPVPEEEIPEFLIGLKMFSEVVLRHRKEPLFADLQPHMGTFIKQLKSRRPDESA